jgi:hypothetical protein
VARCSSQGSCQSVPDISYFLTYYQIRLLPSFLRLLHPSRFLAHLLRVLVRIPFAPPSYFRLINSYLTPHLQTPHTPILPTNRSCNTQRDRDVLPLSSRPILGKDGKLDSNLKVPVTKVSLSRHSRFLSHHTCLPSSPVANNQPIHTALPHPVHS